MVVVKKTPKIKYMATAALMPAVLSEARKNLSSAAMTLRMTEQPMPPMTNR